MRVSEKRPAHNRGVRRALRCASGNARERPPSCGGMQNRKAQADEALAASGAVDDEPLQLIAPRKRQRARGSPAKGPASLTKCLLRDFGTWCVQCQRWWDPVQCYAAQRDEHEATPHRKQGSRATSVHRRFMTAARGPDNPRISAPFVLAPHSPPREFNGLQLVYHKGMSLP
jgi:hypothetical protein